MDYDFYVLIATAGRPDLLNRTLSSLSLCDLPSRYCGTVVVENGLKQSVESIVNSCSPSMLLRYMHVPEPNKSGALNAGLACLPDKSLIFFTDDDVRFDSHVLVNYAKAARSHGDRCFFGGPTGVDYEKKPPEWLLPFLPIAARPFSLTPDEQYVINGHLPIGFNWAAFAGDIRKLGGFNTMRGPGSSINSTGQESEMQRRLLADNVKAVYLSDALVWHYVPIERCRPLWTLNRTFRHGVAWSMDNAVPENHTLFDCPLWMYRSLLRRSLSLFPCLWRRGMQQRFASLNAFAFFLGNIKGTRYVCRKAMQNNVSV